SASTSSVFHQIVQRAGTQTVVASSTNPSTFGQSVTFTATVSVVAPGSGTPTGSVTFIEGGTCAAPTATLAGPTALDGIGQASFNTSALAVATHTLVACYGGSGSFNSSNGNVAQAMNKADTTTTITTDMSTATGVGQSYSVAFTVAATAPGAGTPTGNVTVSDGTDSCTGTIATGSCLM